MNVKCCRLQFPIGGKPRYCKFSRLTEQDGRCRQRAGRWPSVAGSSAPLSSRATGKASGGAGGRGRFGPTVVADWQAEGPSSCPALRPGPREAPRVAGAGRPHSITPRTLGPHPPASRRLRCILLPRPAQGDREWQGEANVRKWGARGRP